MLISPNQGHKDATAIDERSHNAMVLERERFEEIDRFRSPKLLNGDLDSGFSKHLPVIVEIASLQAKVRSTVRPDFLLSIIAHDAHRLFCARAGGVNLRIWFE